MSTLMDIPVKRENDNPSWCYNFVRKTQVLAVKWDYKPGEACLKINKRGLSWIKKANAMGWSASAIARSMKLSPETVRTRIKRIARCEHASL